MLSRVKDFLPKMKEAEEMLEKEIAVHSTSTLDIENVADGAPYIEMVRTRVSRIYIYDKMVLSWPHATGDRWNSQLLGEIQMPYIPTSRW